MKLYVHFLQLVILCEVWVRSPATIPWNSSLLEYEATPTLMPYPGADPTTDDVSSPPPVQSTTMIRLLRSVPTPEVDFTASGDGSDKVNTTVDDSNDQPGVNPTPTIDIHTDVVTSHASAGIDATPSGQVNGGDFFSSLFTVEVITGLSVAGLVIFMLVCLCACVAILCCCCRIPKSDEEEMHLIYQMMEKKNKHGK